MKRLSETDMRHCPRLHQNKHLRSTNNGKNSGVVSAAMPILAQARKFQEGKLCQSAPTSYQPLQTVSERHSRRSLAGSVTE